MPSKKKKQSTKSPAPMRWEFDPDIPIHDFLEENALKDGLDDTVDFFVDWLEDGTFLAWEAVICEEQDLPLTSRQKKALGKLLSFNDEEDDAILYIDEIPRPSEPGRLTCMGRQSVTGGTGSSPPCENMDRACLCRPVWNLQRRSYLPR